MRRIKLAAGGIGAALILVAALAVLHGGALPAPLAQALAAYRDGRFAVAVRERSAAADEARAREDLVRLLVEVRNDLGSPAAIPIDRGAAWRRRLHRDALALADAWAGPAQCVTGGGCTARPADAEACIELSSQLVRIGEAAAVLGALERLLWSGLGGRGLEVPDVRPINTVLDQGCSPVAAIAAGMASAQRAAGAEHDAAASSTWDRIKAMPSQEAVQRYAAVYSAELGPDRRAELQLLSEAMEERERFVASRSFCGTLVAAVAARPNDSKLVRALGKAAVRPAYCVTAPGSATCGWPDLMERLDESFPSGASVRADTLVAAMQSCAPAKGEIERESYENPDNPHCPAEQRVYVSGDLRVNAIVSYCRYAQLKVSRLRAG